MTHFNPQHPENQNIYIPSLKSPITMLYEDNKWNAHTWTKVADRVIDNNVTTIDEWFDRQEGGYPALAQKFHMFVNHADESASFMEELKSEIKLILFNNRKLVHSKEMIALLQSQSARAPHTLSYSHHVHPHSPPPEAAAISSGETRGEAGI